MERRKAMLQKMQKRKKHSQILEDDKHDFLTQLPEPLLHHILSYLTMKDMIRTSVLSKRWRHVWFAVFSYYKLPGFLFSSTSLTVLGLIRCLIGFPINFKLDSLKILSLEQVHFSGGTANDLISCCPILECLSLTNSFRSRKDPLCLMNVGLKTLKICDYSYRSDDRLTVYAPFVLSFELITNLPMKNYVIKRMRHLQSASLDCGKESHGCFGKLNSEDKGHAVVKILDEVNDNPNYNVGEYWKGVEPDFVDLLCNLRTVKLYNFMKNLNLIESEDASSTDEEFPVQLQNDMKFLRFLLNSSKVLERMIITSCKTVKFWHKPESKNLKLRLQLTQELLAFPRASRNAEISFR
ncbi:hypothetical protein U1Q18_001454 [Sarracenia purpurea var. burkii]